MAAKPGAGTEPASMPPACPRSSPRSSVVDGGGRQGPAAPAAPEALMSISSFYSSREQWFSKYGPGTRVWRVRNDSPNNTKQCFTSSAYSAEVSARVACGVTRGHTPSTGHQATRKRFAKGEATPLPTLFWETVGFYLERPTFHLRSMACLFYVKLVLYVSPVLISDVTGKARWNHVNKRLLEPPS